LKINVLDTNVLLEGGFLPVIESLEEPTEVVVPLVVVEELDTFKKGYEAKNEYARACARFLDELRKDGKLHEGVKYENHLIKVHIDEKDLNLDKPDYKIIKTAKETGATIITQDINLRIVADAVGVESKGFAPTDVDANQLYSGYAVITITHKESLEMATWDTEGISAGDRELTNNQFLIMIDDLGARYLGIYKARTHSINKLNVGYRAWDITPKKDKRGEIVIEQIFAMHMLLDPDFQFVSIIGPSGCGKTLLTLAAALEQTLNEPTYKKTMVMRPLVAVGDDIGFLPGDKLEKLEPWMASTFDALDFLLEKSSMEDGEFYTSSKEKIYNLIETGRLELEAMAHIRGRSIPNQFLIIDDAQNLTKHQATTIITRAGEGTKVVFLGDLSEKQIDNHRLTPNSNGLAYVIDRFKGSEIVGHITMNTVVRSGLAQLGVEKL
jgi:PhoH-like ATPase